jgi:PAS domain-containing protein
MTAVRNGETKATVFRIRINEGEVIWIKVTGTVYRKNPRYYIGYMLDVSDTVGIVQEISEKDFESAAVIEGLDYPVILIRADSKNILAHNSAARELFGYKAGEFAQGEQVKNFSTTRSTTTSIAFTRMRRSKKNGKASLFFNTRKMDGSRGKSVIRYLPIHGVRVFRLSIHEVKVDSSGAEAAMWCPYNDSAAPKCRKGKPTNSG